MHPLTLMAVGIYCLPAMLAFIQNLSIGEILLIVVVLVFFYGREITRDLADLLGLRDWR